MSATDENTSTASPTAEAPRKAQNHSCVSCQQRKVKCDRQTPCAACVKSQVECVMRIPLRPRRRPRKVPEAVRDARLKQYEELLKGYGANLDHVDGAGGEERNDLSVVGQATVPVRQGFGQPASELMTPTSEDSERGRLISHDGASKFLDK
jgi:hypothetical protein